MNYKILGATLSLSICLLTACSFGYRTTEPKYKITEGEMKRFVLIGNNKEQCIHPELKGLTFEQAEKQVYSKRTDAEKYLWNKKIAFETFIEVLGEYKANIIYSDIYSQQYFNNMYSKFNNQIANIDQAECSAFKKEWNKELAIAKKLIQEEKQRALARQRQAEKEAKARQEFYATPQGQAYLAQQKLISQ